MNELSELGKRLKFLLEKEKIGINQLGKLTNTSGAQISNIINGKKFGADKLYAILMVFPHIRLDWLLFGEGEMVKKEVTKAKDEIEILNLKLDKQEAIINYQSLTIEAYKKGTEILKESNTLLKELMENRTLKKHG